MAGRYRFGGVEFVVATGELRRVDSSADPDVTRLSRQPATLLALLAEKGGEIATREEIRRRVWNDAAVEFDRGLHFCIHQIRMALGDSAESPRFVETLPRRGYRLIPEVRPLHDRAPATPSGGRRFVTTIAAGLIVVGAVALGVALRRDSGPDPLRIGVMPFHPPSDWPADDVPEIADWILEDLTTTASEGASIVGPTTTIAYDGPDATLRDLGADYDLEYIVNGRFLVDDGEPRMLAELIRVSDGAHVWVRRYDRLDDGRRIGTEIGRQVIAELGLADTD